MRATTHRVVRVDCPVCDLPLPPIVVDVDARATGTAHDGGMLVSLTVAAQELDAAWWNTAREAHPECVPVRPRVREWQ